MTFFRYLFDYIRLNRHLYHLSPAAVSRYQTRAVCRLVRLARRKSPFYRERFAGLPVRDLAEFSKLPVINKPILMDHFDAVNTAGLRLADVMPYAVRKELAKDYLGYYQGRYVIGLSSGTSGNKGLYVTDRRLTERLPGVFLARGGVRLSELPLRILFILRVFSQGFADINAPFLSLRYLPSMTEPAEIIAAINAQRANILMAPPSLLRQLLPLAGQIKTPPRRVICYAEVLPAEDKERFAAAFRAPVVEIYQASEGQIASPCRCGSLHLNEDLVYVELLDEQGRCVSPPPGRTIAQGKTDRTPAGQPEAGARPATRMLVTNLVNTVQPLIRYEMNDLLELGGPCPCGSSFRVISRIIGRQDDVLHLQTASGGLRAVYPDLFSRWIITTDDRIREFMVERLSPTALRLTIDLTPAKPEPIAVQPDDTATIVARLRERIAGELAAFDIVCSLEIRVQPIMLPVDNRKLRRFIAFE
jgi:phenylacetate-coenzyme A ligase PaaK-like adenylate-forming protein